MILYMMIKKIEIPVMRQDSVSNYAFKDFGG